MKTNMQLAMFLSGLTVAGVVLEAQAVTVTPVFSSDYTATSLGSISGLPSQYGGLTFLDSDTILIGGSANTANGRIYSVDITRDSNNRVNGFGTPTALGNVGEYNDGGVVIGPGGVLFTSRWPVNALGQTLPGGTDEAKVIDLAARGVAGSHAALNFVPAGFGGAGDIKLVSWSGGQWYSGQLLPDGSGTYDIVNLNPVALTGGPNLPGGPEGFVYIAAGNPQFTNNSMLVSAYSAGTVVAYDVDSSGNPIVSSARNFITGLSGAEGATIDPVTGDFLFSTFGGGSQIVRVSGFNEPPPPPPPPPGRTPEPETLWLLGACLAAAWLVRRKAVR